MKGERRRWIIKWKLWSFLKTKAKFLEFVECATSFEAMKRKFSLNSLFQRHRICWLQMCRVGLWRHQAWMHWNSYDSSFTAHNSSLLYKHRGDLVIFSSRSSSTRRLHHTTQSSSECTTHFSLFVVQINEKLTESSDSIESQHGRGWTQAFW